MCYQPADGCSVSPYKKVRKEKKCNPATTSQNLTETRITTHGHTHICSNYTNKCLHTHTHTHRQIHRDRQTHTHTHKHTHTHTHTHTHRHTDTQAHNGECHASPCHSPRKAL